MNPLAPLGKPLARPVNNARGEIFPRQLTTDQAPMSLDEEMRKKQMAMETAKRGPLQPLSR
jgi:hypothetical protein